MVRTSTGTTSKTSASSSRKAASSTSRDVRKQNTAKYSPKPGKRVPIRKPAPARTAGVQPAATVAEAGASSGSDPAQWRLRTPVGQTISKGFAKAKYRVSDTDLSTLPRKEERYGLLATVCHICAMLMPSMTACPRIVVHGRYECPMYLYNERDVERKALERHGGPEGFETYLRKLHERYLKSKNANKKPFEQPDRYRVDNSTGGGVYIIQLSPSARQVGRYVGRSVKLLRIKEQLPLWLWKACNFRLECNSYSDGDTGLHGSTKAREAALELVLACNFAAQYPPRADELPPLPSSPALEALRDVLKDAPRSPPSHSKDYGKEAKGLRLEEKDYPYEDLTFYDWDLEYHRRLYTSLKAFIDIHGMGDDGWATIRWEIYQTYCDTLERGIQCDKLEAPGPPTWNDDAVHWLDERVLLANLTRDWPAEEGSSSQIRV
ncbi:hypothetical protein FKP32DRAFT_430268 [Trametes sanguinea]|nr:hypothetical protein FKP32DRAFT_430268 [Trametes sanguinea]